MPNPPAVRPGQIYESCDSRTTARIRITEYTPGSNRAEVVDAVTGKRPRSILARSLHASGSTERGRPRRTGYRLTQDAPNA